MLLLVCLDLAAAILALPALAKDLYAVAASKGSGSLTERLPSRVFRWLDAKTDYLMSPVSYLALFYLMSRLAWITLQSAASPLAKSAVLVATAIVAAVLVYPLVWVYNLAGWAAWRNPPIHLDKARYFARSALLEDPETFRAIRGELQAVMAEGRRSTPRLTEVFRNMSFVDREAGETGGQEWRSFFLRLGNQDLAHNHARMPTLSAILRDMPEVYTAMFSILEPGVSLAPHRGYFKGFVRYHLGVVVPAPDDACLVVAGERYHWREGDGVLFDDMFVHSVENRCQSPRVVLFLDVRRPMGVIGRAVSRVMGWVIDNHPVHRIVRAKL